MSYAFQLSQSNKDFLMISSQVSQPFYPASLPIEILTWNIYSNNPEVFLFWSQPKDRCRLRMKICLLKQNQTNTILARQCRRIRILFCQYMELALTSGKDMNFVGLGVSHNAKGLPQAGEIIESLN